MNIQMFFNNFLSTHKFFFFILVIFIILLMFRHLFIKKKRYICLFHIFLFCILSIIPIIGGSVQSDGYNRLEQFIELEKNNQLNDAKQNLNDYDSMLAIDIQSFNNSEEFQNYLTKHDNLIDRAIAIFIAWFLVLMTDITIGSIYILKSIAPKIRNKFRANITK